MSVHSNRVLTPAIAALWQQCDTVCFDVDSTISTDEGIDILAAHHGVAAAVQAYTTNAMNGEITFQQALSARLQLIAPTQQSFAHCIATHPITLTPRVVELVALLHSHNKQVWLISGGFKQMILPIAQQLNISSDRIIANILHFDANTGAFTHYDTTVPTSKSGGKALALQQLKQQYPTTVQSIVMIGDGITDMEAKSEASLFIGFGGVVSRAKVETGADLFVTQWDELIECLTAKAA